MIYNESLRSTKKKKKTNKIAEWDFKNKVLIRCMAYFAQCSTRIYSICGECKILKDNAPCMTYGTGGSYPHPFECSQDNSISSLPVCPATPCHSRFPPLLPSSSLSMQHVSCLMAPRCALAKIYFYRLPFQFNPIHFARLSISQAACFFFKILIFGHKCGGLAIVHGFGFPIPQQRHFHQDQAKLPRRFWPLALWPIGLDGQKRGIRRKYICLAANQAAKIYWCMTPARKPKGTKTKKKWHRDKCCQKCNVCLLGSTKWVRTEIHFL